MASTFSTRRPAKGAPSIDSAAVRSFLASRCFLQRRPPAADFSLKTADVLSIGHVAIQLFQTMRSLLEKLRPVAVMQSLRSARTD